MRGRERIWECYGGEGSVWIVNLNGISRGVVLRVLFE